MAMPRALFALASLVSVDALKAPPMVDPVLAPEAKASAVQATPAALASPAPEAPAKPALAVAAPALPPRKKKKPPPPAADASPAAPAKAATPTAPANPSPPVEPAAPTASAASKDAAAPAAAAPPKKKKKKPPSVPMKDATPAAAHAPETSVKSTEAVPAATVAPVGPKASATKAVPPVAPPVAPQASAASIAPDAVAVSATKDASTVATPAAPPAAPLAPKTQVANEVQPVKVTAATPATQAAPAAKVRPPTPFWQKPPQPAWPFQPPKPPQRAQHIGWRSREEKALHKAQGKKVQQMAEQYSWIQKVLHHAMGTLGLDPTPKLPSYYVESGKSRNCPGLSFPASYVNPSVSDARGVRLPVELGTPDNIQTDKDNRLDLTGIWWYKGKQDKGHMNTLVSFAGSKTSSDTYPLTLSVPTSGKNMWSYGDGWEAKAAMLFDSITFTGSNQVQNFTFANDGQARVSSRMENMPIALVDSIFLHRVDKDKWVRHTLFKAESVLAGSNLEISQDVQRPPEHHKAGQEMVRIIDMNGDPVPPYWGQYLSSMGSDRQMVFSSDSWCRRTCFSTIKLFDLVGGVDPCSACNVLCGIERVAKREAEAKYQRL